MAAQNALEKLVQDMTLRELSDRSGRTVGDIVQWALRATSSTSSSSPAARPAKASRPASGGGVDVRTPGGRVAYDGAMLEVIASANGPVSAQEARKKVGGTPAQARAALNRLIEAGKLSYQGRARATRYYPKV